MATPLRATLDTAPAEHLREFAAEVRRDLALTPKQLQSKYLYDSLGSCLFEAICRLPWYRITRAENLLLSRHADRIVASLSDPTSVVELGCGSGEKLATLVDAFRRQRRGVRVHLIDISDTALALSEQRLGRLEHVSVVGYRSTYEVGLRSVAAARRRGDRMMVLLLGSNIGNFDPPAARGFLEEIRRALQPGDALLLGTDLTKPEDELVLAYDDPLGVTAAFNRNLLVRMNRELHASFDLSAFAHRAVWNGDASRIEMHLVSLRRQIVPIPAAECVVRFGEGEWIWTESSYKYEPDTVIGTAGLAGFVCRDQWIESRARFALTLFEVPPAISECGMRSAE